MDFGREIRGDWFVLILLMSGRNKGGKVKG